MSHSWAKGSTRAWRTMRAAVLARDGYRCRLEVPGVCTGAAPLAGGHVHHTRGRSVTGDDPRYLLAACEACNLHVGDPTRGNDPPCIPITRWT